MSDAPRQFAIRHRLKESTEMLQSLLDDEAVPDSDRPQIAVQIEYNNEALANPHD